MEWLGLGSTVFLKRETENANGNEGKAFSVCSSESLSEDPIIDVKSGFFAVIPAFFSYLFYFIALVMIVM